MDRPINNRKGSVVSPNLCCHCNDVLIYANFSDTWTMTISGEFYSVPIKKIPCSWCRTCNSVFMNEAGLSVIEEFRQQFIRDNGIRVSRKTPRMLQYVIKKFLPTGEKNANKH